MKIVWSCVKSGFGYTLSGTAKVRKKTAVAAEPLGAIEHLSDKTKTEMLAWASARVEATIKRLLS